MCRGAYARNRGQARRQLLDQPRDSARQIRRDQSDLVQDGDQVRPQVARARSSAVWTAASTGEGGRGRPGPAVGEMGGPTEVPRRQPLRLRQPARPGVGRRCGSTRRGRSRTCLVRPRGRPAGVRKAVAVRPASPPRPPGRAGPRPLLAILPRPGPPARVSGRVERRGDPRRPGRSRLRPATGPRRPGGRSHSGTILRLACGVHRWPSRPAVGTRAREAEARTWVDREPPQAASEPGDRPPPGTRPPVERRLKVAEARKIHGRAIGIEVQQFKSERQKLTVHELVGIGFVD